MFEVAKHLECCVGLVIPRLVFCLRTKSTLYKMVRGYSMGHTDCKAYAWRTTATSNVLTTKCKTLQAIMFEETYNVSP